MPIAPFSFGWSLMVPVVTLMVLDLVPERRGMASSMQACIGSLANGLVAGVIARTDLQLPKGRWRFRTLSDDGVRVLVDGKPVIERLSEEQGRALVAKREWAGSK